MIDTKLTLTLHSAIADSGTWKAKNSKGQVKKHESVKLWYLLRSIDTTGSGSAVIKVKEVAEFCDRSIYTVRRWIAWGKQLGLFRSIVKGSNYQIRIYYASLVKVCLDQGIFDLGAVTEVEISAINHLKFTATEAQIQRSQKQSRFLAKKVAKKRKVPKPSEILQSSQTARGGNPVKRGRFHTLHPRAIFYGASQEGTAKKLGRHKSTVQRRLDDRYRAAHWLMPVEKVQQAITRPENLGAMWQELEDSSHTRFFRPEWSKHLIYEPYTNIYADDLVLKPAGWQRWQLNKAHGLIRKSKERAASLDPNFSISNTYLKGGTPEG